MTTTGTRWRVTATSGIAKGEVALIPGDEDDGIAVPRLGIHDLTYSCTEEGVASRDQLLLVAETAWIS